MNKGILRFRIRALGLLGAAMAVAGVGTVAGFFGRLWWVLDLAAHFRVQYALGLAFGAAVYACVRRFKSSIVMAALALVNVSQVGLLYLRSEVSDLGRPGFPLTLALLNVNTEYGDIRRVERFLEDANPDVVIFEEVNERWMSDLNSVTNRYPHAIAHPREDNFGIAAFCRTPFESAEIVHLGEAGVPSVVCRVRTGDAVLTIVGTHPVPPANAEHVYYRDEQLAALSSYLRSLALPVVLVGDLNITPWSYRYRTLLEDSGLQDSSRGSGVQPTWPAALPWVFRIPIDHALHTEGVRIKARTLGPFVRSDHLPLLLQLEVE